MTRTIEKQDLRMRIFTEDNTISFLVEERYWLFFWSMIHYEEVQIKDFWNPFGTLFDDPIKTTCRSGKYGYFDHETWKPNTFKVEDRIKEIWNRLYNDEELDAQINSELRNIFE